MRIGIMMCALGTGALTSCAADVIITPAARPEYVDVACAVLHEDATPVTEYWADLELPDFSQEQRARVRPVIFGTHLRFTTRTDYSAIVATGALLLTESGVAQYCTDKDGDGAFVRFYLPDT